MLIWDDAFANAWSPVFPERFSNIRVKLTAMTSWLAHVMFAVYCCALIIWGTYCFCPVFWLVCWFASNFNIGHNFCNIEDRNLIFGMHVYLMELHILSGEGSRSSFNVKGRIYGGGGGHSVSHTHLVKTKTKDDRLWVDDLKYCRTTVNCFLVVIA